MGANNEAKVVISGDEEGLQSAMRRASDAVKQSTGQIKENFESFNGVFERIRSNFLMLTGILGGGLLGEKLFETVKETAELGDQLLKLSQKTGIAMEALSKLKYAAELSDVSFDDMQNGLKRLSMNMLMAAEGSRQQKDAFEALGIKITDAHGHLRNMQDVLGDLADKFRGMEDGTGKAAWAMQIFGRQGADMIPMLNGGRDALREAGDEAERLGIVMRGESGEASEKFNDNVTRLHAVMSGIAISITEQFLPALSSMTKSLVTSAKTGGALRTVVTAIVNALKGLILAVALVGAGIKQAFLGLNAVIEDVFGWINLLGKEMMLLASGKFSQMKETFVSGAKEIGQAFHDNLKWALSVGDDFKDFANKLILGDVGGEVGSEEGARKKLKAPPPPDHTHAAGAKSQMAGFSAALADEKTYYQQSNDLREYSKQQEIAYWQQILETHKVSAADRLAIARKISGLELALLKKEANTRKKLDAEAVDAHRTASLGAIAIEEEQANTLQQIGQISGAQMIAMKADFERRKYQIEVAAQQARINALKGDPNADPVAYQQQLDKMVAIKRGHELEMLRIADQSIIEQKKSFDKMFDPLSSAFEKSVNGMIQGTLTFHRAMRKMAQSIAMEFANMGVKIAVNWARNELFKTQATVAGVAARGAAEKAGAVQSIAMSAMAAIKNIANSAWEVFAGAFKAIVGIPYVGPFLAPAVAAGAMGVVMAVAGNIASASGGYDIPSGINPITQLHQREMVLPAKYADVIRGMSNQRGTPGGGDVHLHINGAGLIDAKGFERWLKANAHTTAPALRALARNFTPAKR